MECLRRGVVYNLACSVSAVCLGSPTNQERDGGLHGLGRLEKGIW